MLQDELTPQERDEMAGRMAERVVKRRLETAATLFLEMHKPIAFLGGQALFVAAPILGTLFGAENMQRLALFFQSGENIEALLQRIEALTRERDAHKADESGGPAIAPEGSH